MDSRAGRARNGGDRRLTLSPFDLLSVGFWAAIIGIYFVGWLVPLENVLRDQRFRATRVVTNDIVFVDIDAETLASVGVWPWPRSIYGRLIDRLLDAGATDILLDIDFSTASSESEDQALKSALERAGGFVMMAAFQNGAGDSQNLPLPRFREHSMAVTVNVGVDARGVVRTYPYGLHLAGDPVPSAATALAGRIVGTGSRLPHRLLDRCQRDRDDFGGRCTFRNLWSDAIRTSAGGDRGECPGTPRHLRDPGCAYRPRCAGPNRRGRDAKAGPRASSARTLADNGRHRSACVVGARYPFAGATAVALVGGVDAATAIEGLAFLLQSRFALLFDTAALQLALGFFLLRAMGVEIAIERLLRLTASRERDAMRKILDRVIADNFDGVVVVDADGRVLASSSARRHGSRSQGLGG